MATQLPHALNNTNSSNGGITPQNVKLALLRREKPIAQTNPLECLLVIDDYLSHQLFPSSPYSRQIALVEILISIINEQLIYHRNAMEIPYKPPDSTRREAFIAIKRDVKTGNSRLIGWTWLYYGYVRVDLDITQQMFTLRTRVDDRSIRRYQEVALLSITHILIHKEAIARRSRILETEALIRKEFAEGEITITLKPHTVLEMIRSDQSLQYAFIELLKKTDKILFSMEPHY